MGIEGVNLGELPPKVYACLFKLQKLEHPDIQPTNGDRIRAMTDTELVKFLADLQGEAALAAVSGEKLDLVDMDWITDIYQ